MYNPETKRQGATWLSPKKLKAQKVRMQKSWVKKMFAAFFYAKGIIHHEFVLEKETVSGKFYKEVMKRLITRVHSVRPEFQENGSWFLLHDTAPAHYPSTVSEFLAKQRIRVIPSTLLA
jgi:hypothetical protein